VGLHQLPITTSLLHGNGSSIVMAEEDCLLPHLNVPGSANLLNVHQAGFPATTINLALQGNALGVSAMGPAQDCAGQHPDQPVKSFG
jgi:hypothetical protein